VIKQGQRSAQWKLGMCYECGEAVEKDIQKAVHLYIQAAKQGHSRAQRHLSHCYRTGRGVPVDLAKAKKWRQRAIENGERP
jgi:TPR repeat protein